MTAASEFWAAGTQILWQSRSPQGLPWIDPITVVRHDSGGLVAWLAAGTETPQPRRPDGADLRRDKSKLFTGERVAVRRPWRHNNVLRIAPTGKRWSVWLFWDCETRQFKGWYGNLEAPLQRNGNMMLTRDHTLDLQIALDRRYARKDEDELEIALSVGWYTQEEVDQILDDAAELEAVIDAWGPPFCDGWDNFNPDPMWPVPELPSRYRDRPSVND